MTLTRAGSAFCFDEYSSSYTFGWRMATSANQYESRQFVVLRRFRDLPIAFLFASILDSASVEYFLADQHTIRMNWFLSNALGGIKLCVRKEEADIASDLLRQSVPEKFGVDGVGEYEQPRCPECQSLEISFQGLNRPADYTRALLGGFLPHHRSIWECDSCGHQWAESSEKPPANFLTSASSILLIVLAIQNIGSLLLWVTFLFIQAVRFVIGR